MAFESENTVSRLSNGKFYASWVRNCSKAKSTYPTTPRGQASNASDELRVRLRQRVCHFTERQKLVNDDETTVKKLGFDAIAVVVKEARVLYFHVPQVRLNNQSITCICNQSAAYHYTDQHIIYLNS